MTDEITRRPAMPIDWPGVGDRQLVAALQARDERAYEEFLRRFEVKMYSLARGLTRNEHDAQDAVSETLLSVFKNIARFKGESSLSTWVYRITVNTALMSLRKKRNEQKNIPIEDYMPSFDDSGHRVAVVPDWHPAVDEVLFNKEMAGLLRKFIAELAPEYRTVFLLRDQEGLDNEEVANILNLSVAAVKSRLHRARMYLRERVKRHV
ncbi:MAG TPA: sigma-70 family RNA polymerase sigma factor, partial [Candidatus Polarisedimenticolia bacterium]|nr:sigma-70 family RNA polymerase sigma factor [Candidatus Polarisedimenticolia bacterium]